MFTVLAKYSKTNNGLPVANTMTGIKTWESKWEREVGDKIRYEGGEWFVLYTADSREDANSFRVQFLELYKTKFGGRWGNVKSKF